MAHEGVFERVVNDFVVAVDEPVARADAGVEEDDALPMADAEAEHVAHLASKRMTLGKGDGGEVERYDVVERHTDHHPTVGRRGLVLQPQGCGGVPGRLRVVLPLRATIGP